MSNSPDHKDEKSERRLSRRSLLAGLGGGALIGGATLSGGAAFAQTGGSATNSPQHQFTPSRAADLIGKSSVSCHGSHQAGITTSLQSHSAFVSLDIQSLVTRSELKALMQKWSRSIELMTQGQPTEGDRNEEFFSFGPASLTVTVSFGPGFFDRDGLRDAKPDGLNALPPFHHDQLKPKWTGGDLMIQACSDDATIASHAARVLMAQARSLTEVRWTQNGFVRAAGTTTTSGFTHRNLMGQLDGSGNPRPDNSDFDKIVWADQSTTDWGTGGSYVVYRKIRMLLDHWDVHTREEQEDHIGRTKTTGAPLTGGTEFDEPDFSAQRADGRLVIPADAHVRLTHHSSTNGARILRRGYSYDDGYLANGDNDSGLFFVAWQADPRKGFLPIQARMDVGDALNHMTVPEGSAIGFAPPGFQPGGYIGDTLF